MKSSSIKRARKAAGMTQEDLASALGINRATISKYESGNIPITVQQLEEIARALHTTVGEIIDSKQDEASCKSPKHTAKINARIKKRRMECGLSVIEVAAALNVSRATVYRYESDEIENMGSDKLGPLAKVLRTTPEYLMGWTDECLPQVPSDFKSEAKARLIGAITIMDEENAEKLWCIVENMYTTKE